MKINQILLVLLSILIIGCKNRNQNSTEIADINETPKILEANVKNEIYKSSSKRYTGNIIEQLYEEALEKDEKLKLLDKKIEKITSDSLKQKTKNYRKYSEVNREYWTVAKNYAQNINDSITKESTIEIINKLEKDYYKSVSKYEEKMNEIDEQKLELENQIILMKLFITEPMISNYQKNELPNISELETVIEYYQKLIRETEQYTTIKK